MILCTTRSATSAETYDGTSYKVEGTNGKWAPSHINNSSIPGRRTIGRLVLGWVTVFGRAYHFGMQPHTQANSASYPLWDGK